MFRRNTFFTTLFIVFIFLLAPFIVPLPIGITKEIGWDGAPGTIITYEEEAVTQPRVDGHITCCGISSIVTEDTPEIIQSHIIQNHIPLPLHFVYFASEALGAEMGPGEDIRVASVHSPNGTVGQGVNTTSPLLKVHFIDVGQADSILIQLPDGKNILIDGGNNADGPDVVSYLKAQGVRLLDYVVATHPHEDHIGGLDTAINAFDVGKVYAPRVTSNTQTFEDFLLAVQRKGLKINEAKAGVTLDAGPKTTAVFVAPNGTGYDNLNNYSAVLRLTYGQTSFLFTGDAEIESETEMLQAGHNLKADVLKVCHHGSDSSTSPKFLAAVKPKYAVISVGAENDYGHPSPDVLVRLAKAGVDIYRTDEVGTIVVTSDGQKVAFNKAASHIKERAPNTTEKTSTPKTPKGKETLVIQSVDLQAEKVIIANNSGQDVDMSGWVLISEKGNQKFVFPRGTVIPGGGVIKVVSGPQAKKAPGVLVWGKGNIWNNKGDPAALYDAQGKLISRK